MEVRLANEPLWKQFHKHTTEMIVTKSGRKMFPKLEFTIEGLDPDMHYAMVLRMEQVDKQRYKFSGGEWAPAGRGEDMISRGVNHHDGGMRGSQWMRSPVVFERLKITNNPNDHNQSHVFLHSMHKYIPVLSIYPVYSDASVIPAFTLEPIKTVKIPYTEFIAVTAYQNDNVRSLKISHNPFARGFREGGDRKRAGSRSSHSDSEPSPKCSRSPLPPPPTVAPELIPTTLSQIVPPIWYPHIWNPYLINPLLSPYRYVLPRP